MSDLFGFINTMFSKPAEFHKTKLNDRAKHFFMINRFMSIKYPVQAGYFNHIKINPGQTVTYWQENLSKIYNKTPGWMYVKTAKAKEAKKKAEQPISDQAIQLYCEYNKISRKDVDDALKLLGNAFEEELRNFEKMVTQ
jgi:hypothetical protein